MQVESTTYGVYEFGDEGQLEVIQKVIPELTHGQVLLRVFSTSVNPIDIKTRQGLGYVAANKQPSAFLPLGYDVYGEVLAVADKDSGISVGQHVIGMVGFANSPGTYSDYHVVSESQVMPVAPQQKEEIAGLCLAGLTAKQAIDKFAQSDKPLLVSAATGGVGHLAIQIAKLYGKRVVALTSRKTHPLLAQLDIDVMDYEQLARQQIDADLLDLVGGEIACSVLSRLKENARIVTIPSVTKELVCQAAEQYGHHCEGMLVHSNIEDLKYLYERYSIGKIQLAVSHTFTLEEIATAHRFMNSATHFGKVIVKA
ncbi:NADP-dependent oxidoreductase [Pseudoalteromonas sp. T1lg65]|uniref:NADP-dependent oxidoreductase n=1 Tax=Pseudoalteromonas sp. T1lg65 TaxID=2077101 RepID=UPI003F7A76E0